MVNPEINNSGDSAFQKHANIGTACDSPVCSQKLATIDDEIIESTMMIDDQLIGYCSYGHGETKLLFICGGVGKYWNIFLQIYPFFFIFS